MDIFDQIGQIPAIQDFQSHTMRDRVRTFLCRQYGPRWEEAAVSCQAMPTGATVWVAWMSVLPDEYILQFVEEMPDGQLVVSSKPLFIGGEQPISGDCDLTGDAAGSVATHDEQSALSEGLCVGEIGAAFVGIAKVLRIALIPQAEKKYLIGQLLHARAHLRRALERRRRKET